MCCSTNNGSTAPFISPLFTELTSPSSSSSSSSSELVNSILSDTLLTLLSFYFIFTIKFVVLLLKPLQQLLSSLTHTVRKPCHFSDVHCIRRRRRPRHDSMGMDHVVATKSTTTIITNTTTATTITTTSTTNITGVKTGDSNRFHGVLLKTSEDTFRCHAYLYVPAVERWIMS